MKASERIIQFIKDQENFSAKRYFCPAGKLTIGYGHVINKEMFNSSITKKDADRILRLDIEKRSKWLENNLPKDVGQNKFDALISLIFNSTNDGNLKKVAPKAFEYICEKNYEDAAIELFSKEKGLVKVRINGRIQLCQGLVNRRAKELEIWNEFDEL